MFTKTNAALLALAFFLVGCATTQSTQDQEKEVWDSILRRIDVEVKGVRAAAGEGGSKCEPLCEGFPERIKRYQALVDEVSARDVYHEPARRELFVLYLALVQAAGTTCCCTEWNTAGLKVPPSPVQPDNGPPPMLRVKKQ